MITFTEEALHGAKVILRDCLALECDQELILIIDETTIDVAPALYQAAYQLGARCTVIFVPLAQQKAIKQLGDLPHAMQVALTNARVILTCINGDSPYTDFRHVILNHFCRARTRIGHMPGAAAVVLEAANVDLKTLSKACHNMELPLARGRELELITYDANGQDYHLYAQIGGWQRLPVASDGLIPEGGWGNVPSGETYIAPFENTAHGQVYVIGAFDKLIIPPESGVLLAFDHGRLIPPQPPFSPVEKRLLEEARPALESGDSNWTCLAEVGIGLNPRIKRLTGNMLLDEKMDTTAHIAIGRSTDLGGLIESSIHVDMVIVQPTILVDRKPILDHGRLVLRRADWQEDYNHLPEDLLLPEVDQPISRAAEAKQIGGRLYRIARSDTGHTSEIQVGADNTAREAAKLYQLIPPVREGISASQLARAVHRELNIVCRVLAVMVAFEVVRFEPNPVVEEGLDAFR
jgi:leucyl aminopeptidase (aminopeptidase T)